MKINIKAKNSFNFLKGGQYLPDCQMFFIKISTNMLKKLPNLRGQYAPYYPPYFKNEKSLIGYLFQSIFLGGIFGWMGLYFLSYAIALVGVFFKSNTHGDKIINIIAYSYVSIILVLFVVLIEFISYSILGFPNEIALLFRIFALAKLIIQIFCIVLLVIGVSKVQGLTILKGLITILVPIIIFSGIIYGFVLIFK